MTDIKPDPIHEKIVEGVRASMTTAIEKARQTGTTLIFWREGKIVEISADEADKEINELNLARIKKE